MAGIHLKSGFIRIIFPVLLLQVTIPNAYPQTEPDSILTEKQYFSGLQDTEEKEFRKDFEPYFLLILSPHQKKSYASYEGLDERKAYMYYYWKASNPNPLLPENDWLLEFNRRVAYAKKHFPHIRPPYVDDRGKMYIRYGKPRRRFEDSGGSIRALFFNKENVQGHFKLAGPLNYSIAANETWSYENVADDFLVHFVKEGAYFREISSLDELVVSGNRVNQVVIPSDNVGGGGGTRDPNWAYWYWADMMKRRAAASPTLARAAAKIVNLEQSIEFAIGSSSGGYFFAEELATPQSILKTQANEIDFAVKMVREQAPAAAHDPVQMENKIEFFDRITQLRGPNGKTRIEVTILAPLEKNVTKKVKKSSKDTLEMAYSSMLRDGNFNPVIRNQSAASIEIRLAAKEKLPNAVGRMMLLAEMQQAELTLQVSANVKSPDEKDMKQKTGFYRQPIEIKDFSGEQLMISEVTLLYEVEKDAQRKILPTLAIESLPASPYPYEKIRKKEPPLFYFEIYNIRTSGIADALEISYTVSEIKGEKRSDASVSASYTRPVTGDNMQELIEIDLRNVDKGRHLLEVTVRGKDKPNITATQVSVIEVE